MKLITQTDKHNFYVVEVPRGAKNFYISAHDFLCGNLPGQVSEPFCELIGDFEIIGIQGGEDSLNEEQLTGDGLIYVNILMDFIEEWSKLNNL